MRREPWFFDHEKLFGAVCPHCGGPIYRYCPGCGADLSGKEHVVVQRNKKSMPHPLSVCVDCAKDMQKITEMVAKMKAEMNQL